MLNILSEIPTGIALNLDDLVQRLEYCNIVYMCIKESNSCIYKIPDNILAILEPILNTIWLENSKQYEDKYCYVTIKKMYVQPQTVGNREGLHIDGFLSDQRNFIWFDSIPTAVAVGKFNLSEDHHLSLEEIKEQVEKNDYGSRMLRCNHLYELTQNCVHEPTENFKDSVVLRTFIKVTFSKELFNGFGNAWNYMIPHIKSNKNRSAERNHGTIY